MKYYRRADGSYQSSMIDPASDALTEITEAEFNAVMDDLNAENEQAQAMEQSREQRIAELEREIAKRDAAIEALTAENAELEQSNLSLEAARTRLLRQMKKEATT